MTKAGREPTEDVKRAFRRAIEFVGLEVWKVRMIKMDEHGGRWVVGWAKPEWWKHDSPAIEIQTFVKFSSKVETVEIRCMACDDDPVAHALDAPHVQDCYCSLAELPQVPKEVWAARGSVVQRWKDGECPPIYDGRWTWEQADPSDGIDEP